MTLTTPILTLCLALLPLAGATGLAGCDDVATDPAPTERGAAAIAGKADSGGSCQERCGVEGVGGCWCDDQCEAYGDCCSDYVAWCVASGAEDKCEATGGAWFEGACECEQDGASLGWTFDDQRGCVPPETGYADLAERFFPSDATASFGWGDFDSEHGVYLVTRPGAFDDVAHFDSITALGAAVDGLRDRLDALYCPMNFEGVDYDCSDGFTDATGYGIDGCFLESGAGAGDGRVTEVMTLMNDAYGDFFSAEALAQAAAVDALVTATVTITWEHLRLSFGEIDGSLRLLVVDVAIFDCSA